MTYIKHILLLFLSVFILGISSGCATLPNAAEKIDAAPTAQEPPQIVSAGIGTAVALYPVVKRQGEARALGFVGSRTLEAATIYVGIVSLMSIVTLRQAGAGAQALVTGHALAAQYYWTFFFAQSFIPAVNGVLLGSLLYQSRLVPRWLPVLGFIGAALLVASWFAILFGLLGPVVPASALLALPIAAWEFSLGVYLTFWGFRPSPITAGM